MKNSSLGALICVCCCSRSHCRARIEDVRLLELRQKRRIALLGAINTTIVNMGPMCIALLTFLVYGLTSSQPLTAMKAFASLALFNIMRVALLVLPMVSAIIRDV